MPRHDTRFYVRQITPGNTRLFSIKAFPYAAKVYHVDDSDAEQAQDAINKIREIWPDIKFELVRIDTRTETVDESNPHRSKAEYQDLLTEYQHLFNQLLTYREILQDRCTRVMRDLEDTQELLDNYSTTGGDSQEMQRIKSFDRGRKKAYLSAISLLGAIDAIRESDIKKAENREKGGN